ncbi:hypothetical protein EDI_255420 [Entamoeba dispar SAW760]|uniref:Leucine rich repeat containing protein BspA family protein n=1 Tax=Entamoeba dispar (strain ATCC PRA-260 / SAW760) TaxID=370354 RepID=B0EUN8_ENTDS|nr:uncharacterized protein EDI_255420 [Entamoeba dispar SAW760]EDR21759.1 hypothetical protein EDI_255420 [Entamoeba dispar SAW760]|eukprot:EDR21759.1 hypothetical protein EDI_255420 [Entamoeba dispar SAW760]
MKLGYNEIMIVSKYFNDINDFINLEIGIKRFRGNMERFHFNPIPLDEYSRKLFPNIETFHIYNYNDKIFKDGKIFKKVVWYLVDYSKYLKEKEEWDIYKNIEYAIAYEIYNYSNTIPPEVKSLGYQCFKGCDRLTSINIPTTISKIGCNCFEGCTSLTSINIPTTISKLGSYCFKNCPSLKAIDIPTSISEIGDNCFYGCHSLKSINIPTSVSEIGGYCFNGCLSLTSITIPSSISKIGCGRFYEWSSLTPINIGNIKFISEERMFVNEPVLVSIKIPYDLEIINGKNIEKKDINEFIIPTTITKLGWNCFEGCTSLKSINIPSSIKEIGDRCFKNCSSLTSMNIPSSISKIGDGCFSECSSLKSINIPSSISKIGAYCFYKCSSLTSMNIPSSITSF